LGGVKQHLAVVCCGDGCIPYAFAIPTNDDAAMNYAFTPWASGVAYLKENDESLAK